jgi:hypothetical protein
MITIKISNAREIVKRERSWLVAKLAPYFVDVQTSVEKEIAEEIKKSLQGQDIQAEVSVVKEE